MAQVSKYRYLLNQYPETVQKEQFRIICHISKRTARYLLQSGLVPCVQSGKKTRNYTIKMKDIVRYLERREIHPEKYKLPPGSYSGTYAVKAFQSLPIFNCQIPYTVKVGDANSYGMSVMELEQANPASLAYLELAKEVLANA